MKLILSITLPGVLAQTLGSQPLTLYNGGNLLYPNCASKTNACDCHYASCSLTGDCACGWDDTTKTCQAGITTKCVSCPAMRRCSVAEKLIIGPDGFPVPGQLSVWGGVPYPDGSGMVGQSSSSTQGSSQVSSSQTTSGMMSNQMSSGRMSGQMSGQMSNQMSSPGRMSGQMSGQYQASYGQMSGQMSGTGMSGQMSSPSFQTTAQYFGQPSVASTTAQQVFGTPISLYQDTVLSASGCAAKRDACDCHYASCTPTGDCLCGWDASTQTCRAGIPTQCVSCPSMGRCGVREPLLIGPDGFPIPGQLSVWGSVPYPDQVNQTNTRTTVQQTTTTSTTVQNTGRGKAGKAGKAGNAVRNQTRVGM